MPRSFLQYISLSELGKQKTKSKTNYDEDLSDREDDTDQPIHEIAEDEIDFEDAAEDLLIVSTGALGIRSSNKVPMTENCPVVQVADGKGQPKVIRKSSLISL